MTRSSQPTQAVTAERTARTAASGLPSPAPTKFLIFEDNGGAYQWKIVARSGETLVRFASLAAGRKTAVMRDGLAAGRWLDDGGSFSTRR